jgi:hypothetical protein
MIGVEEQPWSAISLPAKTLVRTRKRLRTACGERIQASPQSFIIFSHETPPAFNLQTALCVITTFHIHGSQVFSGIWTPVKLSIVELSMPAYHHFYRRPCSNYDRIRSLNRMLYHRVCIWLHYVLYKISCVFSLELRSVFHIAFSQSASSELRILPHFNSTHITFLNSSIFAPSLTTQYCKSATQHNGRSPSRSAFRPSHAMDLWQPIIPIPRRARRLRTASSVHNSTQLREKHQANPIDSSRTYRNIRCRCYQLAVVKRK